MKERKLKVTYAPGSEYKEQIPALSYDSISLLYLYHNN